ncbi:MAG: CRISPR-associated endonuclease Cas2 [Bradymonadaceae bacterium]|nr:CRISPR-associated endonuclease Cas2 [Lujinxingiaceae bacterium]
MNVYIVTYDICDAKRLRRVFQYLRRWGDHLQYSVFRCELSRRDLAQLGAGLHEIIHHSEDQILFFDLGPHDGRARQAVDALGLPYTHPERHAFVF